MNTAARLKAQNNGLQVWRSCRRHRKPVTGCPRCPKYTANGDPNAPGNSLTGAGASPLGEFMDSRQPVAQGDPAPPGTDGRYRGR